MMTPWEKNRLAIQIVEQKMEQIQRVDEMQMNSVRKTLEGLQTLQRELNQRVDSVNALLQEYVHLLETLRTTQMKQNEWLNALQNGIETSHRDMQILQEKNAEQDRYLTGHTKWLGSLQSGLDGIVQTDAAVQRKNTEQDIFLDKHSEWLQNLQNAVSGFAQDIRAVQEKNAQQDIFLDKHSEWLQNLQNAVSGFAQDIRAVQEKNAQQDGYLSEHSAWLESLEKNVQISRTVEDIQKDEIKKLFEIQKESSATLRGKKKALIIGTCEHDNIGDAAITLAEIDFLYKYFPEYTQVQISTYRFDEQYAFLHNILNPEDIVFLHGGGNIGSLYEAEETLHRTIAEEFPNNRIVVFPQTIDFAEDDNGKKQLKKSKEIYNRHKDLTIFTRGQKSFQFAKKHFYNAKVFLMPDIVNFYDPGYSCTRSGALLVLRNDKEGWLKEEDKIAIQAAIREKYTIVNQSTNTVAEGIPADKRALVVRNEIKKYACAELVVTDRLHGLIFAAITNTPCILLNESGEKISDYYQTFLKPSSAVIWLKKNVDQISEAVERIQKTESVSYHSIAADYLAVLLKALHLE